MKKYMYRFFFYVVIGVLPYGLLLFVACHVRPLARVLARMMKKAQFNAPL